jgi:hypothetical protein
MDLKPFTDEPKIISRGGSYLTPMTEDHIDELVRVLAFENVRELAMSGQTNIREALEEMYSTCEMYVVRSKEGDLLCMGGLSYNDDWPQLFAMFSRRMKENFHLMARGSKMLINFLDKTQEGMTMTILSEYAPMINWAAWLGFEPIGISEDKNIKYVEFVRCNPNKNNVYNSASRPATH